MAKAKASSAGDGIERIDAHVHGKPFGEVRYRGSGSAYVKKIRKQGIHAVVLLAPGEACMKAVDKFGDFILPVPMYRLRRGRLDEIRRDMEHWMDRGCRGAKFIAPLAPYSDRRYWPLYRAVLERGLTAVFHTGYLGFGGRRAESPPTEMNDMRAARVDAVARRLPDLKILMAHFSNPWWEEAWKVSWTRKNIYADLSGGTGFRRSMSMWAETFAPDGRLMEDSLAKILFASDVSYLHSGEHGFAPYVDFYQRLLDRVDAPEALRRKVWSGNARMLFGLDGA